MVGIKDIHCKIIGSVNPLNIVRATFKGLESQVSLTCWPIEKEFNLSLFDRRHTSSWLIERNATW